MYRQVLASLVTLARLNNILLSLLAIYILQQVVKFIQERRRIHQVFKRGNVVQVNDPPGLFGGDLLSILSRGDNTDVMHRLHLKLGKTYGIFYGPSPWAVTVDLELIHKVFVAEGSIHVNITQLRLPFVREINESLAQITGDKWRQVRRVMGPSFTMRHMKSDNVFSDISRVCDIFMDFIEAHKLVKTSEHIGHEDKQRSRIVDVHYGFKKFSLEVIFRVAFGQEYKTNLMPYENDKLIDWLNEGTHMLHGPFVQIGIIFDWAQKLLGLVAPLTPLGRVISYVHEVIEESLKKRRDILSKSADSSSTVKNGYNKDKSNSASSSNFKQQHERKAIDSLIERFDTGRMSDDCLKANLFFILLAGYETTANTLTLLFYYLASNGDVQERLRESILKGQTEYMDWVIQETLRLFPAVPVAIGRVLEHDIEHKGQKFYKGTTVVADIWSIHRWPEYWRRENFDYNQETIEEDLEKFRPERFGEPQPAGIPDGRYFAFAMGPRYCIGQNLALSEIKAIVERIMSKYRVSLCSASPKEIDAVSPNLIHFIINHDVDLEFTEINSFSLH